MPCMRCGDIIPAEVVRCPSCGTRMHGRDFRAMASAVFMLLGLDAFLALGSGVGLQHLSGTLDAATIDSYRTQDTLRRLTPYAGALALSVALAALTGVAFLMWLWRAHRYAGLSGRPWVIAGWLCPLANLWVPPRLMHLVWSYGRPPAERRRSAAVVTAWWFTLLCAIGLEWAFTTAGADNLAQARATVRLGILGSGVHALAAVLCMAVVFQITLTRSRPPDHA